MLPTVAAWFGNVRRQNLMDDDLTEAKMFFALCKRPKTEEPGPGGSRLGRKPNAERDFEDGYERI